jgi:site-specific DNA-cytosine methylase
VERLRPKFVVIENVPQMLSHGFDGRLGNLAEIVIEMLEKEMKYSVAVAVVNAANYGVPQLRERAIFIASAVGAASFPEQTHSDPSKARSTGQCKLPWVTVADAIQDLPIPTSGKDDCVGPPRAYLPTTSEYAKAMQSKHDFPRNHISRPYGESVLRIIREMRPGETWDAESIRMQTRYARAIQRYSVANKMSKALARNALVKSGVINPVFYKRYYWSAYTRLAWESPALTITANANFLGSGRFTHPVEMRGITMREAARLQSFDDEFRFVTSDDNVDETSKIGVGLDMIGEAVPPLLARAIAQHFAEQLDARAEPGLRDRVAKIA